MKNFQSAQVAGGNEYACQFAASLPPPASHPFRGVILAPMLVVLMARSLLGERIGTLGWKAAVIGLAGVLLRARPGSGLRATGMICGLCAVGANASYQLLSRVLASTERTIALLFLSIRITGGIGHYLFTAAFRHAPASLLAAVNYFQLLWAGLLGWIAFKSRRPAA